MKLQEGFLILIGNLADDADHILPRTRALCCLAVAALVLITNACVRATEIERSIPELRPYLIQLVDMQIEPKCPPAGMLPALPMHVLYLLTLILSWYCCRPKGCPGAQGHVAAGGGLLSAQLHLLSTDARRACSRQSHRRTARKEVPSSRHFH
jgi:hypothetical protein